MQFIKSKRGLAALLLIGVSVLGVTFIVNAIDIVVDFTDSGFHDDHPHSEWISINEETLTVSCYIWGAFWVEDEENGDRLIGGINAQGAAWINADQSVTLFSYSYSHLYASERDVAAKANAWIKFPRERIIPHPDGPGEVDVGKGADKLGIQIYDTRTYQLGDKNMWGKLQGAASLRVPKLRHRIQVRYIAKAVL